MEILMTHVRDEQSRAVADGLRASGHQVFTCDSQHAHSSLACAALQGEGCPVDANRVDVALHVPLDATMPPGIEDEGILCALRQHIPLVVFSGAATWGAEAPGPDAAAGFVPWAAAVCGSDELETTLAWAATEPLRDHTAAAAGAANAVLERHGVPGSFEVTVRRSNGQLRVDLVADAPVPEQVRRDAAVRAHDAVRTLDQENTAVDVSVGAPEA